VIIVGLQYSITLLTLFEIGPESDCNAVCAESAESVAPLRGLARVENALPCFLDRTDQKPILPCSLAPRVPLPFSAKRDINALGVETRRGKASEDLPE
jgi:hypothetical protein